MGRVAPLRAPQQIPAFAIGRHAATAAMNECYGAVDFRMVVENPRSIDFLGNELCDRSRAVYGGENADIIPRARFSVWPQITVESRAQLGRQGLIVPCGLGKSVVAGEVMQADIMLVYPIAGRNRL